MQEIFTKNYLERVETGALRINNDHPGLFIRGDDAFRLEIILGKILRKESLDELELVVLERYYFEINRRVCKRP